MNIIIKGFQQLTNEELYSLLKLRVDVFIIEQKCIYNEIDNQDQKAQHLLLKEKNNELVGYARILFEKSELHIGRILTKSTYRNLGLGKQVILKAIEFCEEHFPNEQIHISAQAHLEPYYHTIGFRTISTEAYDWDGILHVDMIYPLKA